MMRENTSYYVASVYLPDNSKDKEADEVVRQLYIDIDEMPECADHYHGRLELRPLQQQGKK